jgi:hypothetical protein
MTTHGSGCCKELVGRSYHGLLVCWCAGVLVCWCAGVLVCWCAGVLVCCWCAGVPHHSSSPATATPPCDLTVIIIIMWLVLHWLPLQILSIDDVP